MARHVEDASETLGDTPSCLEILNEVHDANDSPPPWATNQLAGAIDAWTRSKNADVAPLQRSPPTSADASSAVC